MQSIKKFLLFFVKRGKYVVICRKKKNAYGIIGQVGGRLWIEEKMIEDIEAGRKCCVTEDEEESGHA